MASTTFPTLEGGLSGVKLVSDTGFTSEVYDHGAHVASWRDASGKDIIFLSTAAQFAPPKAIRGGIPICFPQFSDLGPCSAQHGFARNMRWQVVGKESTSVDGQVTFRLQSSEESKKVWPHNFVADFVVMLTGEQMETQLIVTNPDDTPFEFTVALHTYFAVGDIGKSKVVGLQNVKYLDSLDGRIEKTEPNDAVLFQSEVDRIYQQTPDTITVQDNLNARTITIKKSNLPDAVVWNPWITKCEATSDLGNDDYKSFLCVEAAATENKIVVQPGGSWTCGQVLTVEGM